MVEWDETRNSPFATRCYDHQPGMSTKDTKDTKQLVLDQ
jgi:hypothetical protein